MSILMPTAEPKEKDAAVEAKFQRLLELDRDSAEFARLYAEVDRLIEAEMQKEQRELN